MEILENEQEFKDNAEKGHIVEEYHTDYTSCAK